MGFNKCYERVSVMTLSGGGAMLHKPLPVGVEDFEDMITSGYYYIDKT